jgi:membrane associated rhomboid family serine protease
VIRSLGGNASQLFILIAINFALGFIVSGISWQGHLGGMLTGFLIAVIFSSNRRPNQKLTQLVGLGLVWVVIVFLTQFRVNMWI